MAPGILDSIDGALRDYGTSCDAMRWMPENKRLAAPHRESPAPASGRVSLEPPAVLILSVDTEEFARSLNDLAEAMARVLNPVVEDTAKLFHALSHALFPSQHRRCWTCHPSRKPKPLAVNGHEYQRRLRARRRRRAGR